MVEKQMLIGRKLEVEIKKMASFYRSFIYTGQVRCDLLPRWDREGKYVVVDSAKDKLKKILVINTYKVDKK